jgi:hypothetical protein
MTATSIRDEVLFLTETANLLFGPSHNPERTEYLVVAFESAWDGHKRAKPAPTYSFLQLVDALTFPPPQVLARN